MTVSFIVKKPCLKRPLNSISVLFQFLFYFEIDEDGIFLNLPKIHFIGRR